MPTTDAHSPINAALGIPDRWRFVDAVVGDVYECLICQEHSLFADRQSPGDFSAFAWIMEHDKKHPGELVNYFVWNVVRSRIKR